MTFTKRESLNLSGFTLVEILVAVTIFSMVVVVSANVFIRVSQAQQEAQAWQTLQTESQFIMDTIVTDAKQALPNEDLCGASVFAGTCWGNERLSFRIGDDNKHFYYELENKTLYKVLADNITTNIYRSALNSPNIKITDFQAIVTNNSVDPGVFGSMVTLILQAETGTGNKLKTISLQTTVMSQP